MYDAPSWNSPAPNDPEVIDYVTYLRDKYPKNGENAEENISKRLEAIKAFTSEGQPGEKFQILLEKLMGLLQLPDSAKNEL